MSKSLQEYHLELRFRNRIYFLIGFIIFALLVLISRLIELQLVAGYENKLLAKKFASRQEFISAPRGVIFDRHGLETKKPLVQNLLYNDFVIYPANFRNREEGEKYVERFCLLIGRDCSRYSPYLRQGKWKQLVRKNKAITLIRNMEPQEHERIAVLPSVYKDGKVVTQYIRYYTMGPAMAHVSGYIGKPSRRDLKNKDVLSYQLVGKGGIEAHYDQHLRGVDGVRIRYRILDKEEELSGTQDGKQLYTTIDSKIQAASYRALIATGLRGMIVVMKVHTGEILAMVSNPSYDPNILSNGSALQRKEHIAQIQRQRGFLNLSIQAKFPPASLFKPLSALAGLEKDRIETRYLGTSTLGSGPNWDRKKICFCPGHFFLKSSLVSRPDARYNCWKRHRYNDLRGALVHSCNVYFYQLGYRIGSRAMVELSRDFEFDSLTQVDLPGEIRSFIPDEAWKQRRFSSRWYDGDTLNLAIGQGFAQVTPMRMLVFYAALANGARIYKPYLLKEIRAPLSHKLLQSYGPQLIGQAPVEQRNLAYIQSSLRSVVLDGTARFLSKFPVPIAGKTGTVQIHSTEKKKDHAWFASYAPYQKKQELAKNAVAVVVFLEHGLGGGAAVRVSSEVYKAVFPEYFAKNRRTH